MPTPSTRSLRSLPTPDRLKALSKSLAVLDMILMPEWEIRYYSYNNRWGRGEEMASMRNGSGDGYFILFRDHAAILKGFAHESVMGRFAVKHGKPWPGVIDHVPEEFKDFLSEPAFEIGATSFCMWRRREDPVWSIGDVKFPSGPDPDGSETLLRMLDGDPASYQRWCAEYYERSVPLDAIRRVYDHERLTEDLVRAVNPDRRLADLTELAELGYPTLS